MDWPFHHGIKLWFYINLHEIELGCCIISTRNQGKDMDLYSILQDNLALDLVLSTYVTINLLSLFAVAKIKLNLLSVR
jgi:hypothetical protein